MAIKSEISLDSSKAEAEASRAGASIAGKLAKSSQGSGKGFFSGASSEITKAAGALTVVAAEFYALDRAIDFADKFGDLKDGIESVLSPARGINAEMTSLVKLSDGPGLEFQSVAKAHQNFLALGKSSEDSMEIIKEIGNAIQLGGGDPRMLEPIVETLTKMTDKGEANVKTMHSLVSTMPLFRKAFMEGFGTDSVSQLESMHMTGEQFIAGFTAGLQKLGTATKDTADRWGDFKDKFFMSIGDGLQQIDEMIYGKKEAPAPREQKLEDPSARIARENAIAEARKKRLDDMLYEIDLEGKIGLAKQEEQRIEKEISNAAKEDRDALEIDLVIAKERVDTLALIKSGMKDLESIMEKEGMTEAEVLDMKQREIAVQRMIADNATKAALAEKDAAKAADEKVKSAEKYADLQDRIWDEISKQQEADRRSDKEKADRAKDLGKHNRDQAILEAESKGHKGKAERLRHNAALEDKQKELEAMGMSPEGARKQAAQEVRTAEDQAYRDRTGRSRVHGMRTEPDQAFGTAGLAHSAYRKGETTKLTANEIAGTQSGGNSATKAMEGLTAALKNLELAAKKYNASNLNSSN